MARRPATSSGAMLLAISSRAFLFSLFIAEKPCSQWHASRAATLTKARDRSRHGNLADKQFTKQCLHQALLKHC